MLDSICFDFIRTTEKSQGKVLSITANDLCLNKLTLPVSENG
jgi:hypothetical protein